MHETAVALVTSDNAAHGYNWTFAFPMILFIVIAAGLYLVCTRPHRVPGHGPLGLGAGPAQLGPDAARTAATAAGFSTAAGGGAMESAHEAAGAHRAANSYTASGNVSQDVDQAAAPSPGSGAPPAADESSTTASEPPADDNPATDHREAGE